MVCMIKHTLTILITVVLTSIVVILMMNHFTSAPEEVKTQENTISNTNDSVLSGNTELDQVENNNDIEVPVVAKNRTLDLHGQELIKVPEYVFGRTDIEELNLSSNQLEGALQAEVRHLQNLRVLNLSNNRFTGIPAEVGQLSNLEILDLSNNTLTGLPYELGNLSHLKILNLKGNKYAEVDLLIIKEKLPSTVTILVD